MLIKFLKILIPFFLSTIECIGQNTIEGRIVNHDSIGIQSANIILYRSSDSAFVKADIADQNGHFVFKNVVKGNYFLVVSMTGYEQINMVVSAITDMQTINLGLLYLNPEKKLLRDVTVRATKQLFEQKMDKLVINVQNGIALTGASVLEVLENSPGVTIDRQRFSISLNGKTGILVMINGKISYQPIEGILQMLSGMNSSNIEKIELISNPPAKYDAGGTGGIINIVFKKGTETGTNGNISATIGYWQNEKVGLNGLLNHRTANFNLYGDFSYYQNHTGEVYTNYRSVILDSSNYVTSTITKRDPIYGDFNARLGLDYTLSKKTTLGGLLSGYSNKWTMNATNTAELEKNSILDTSIAIKNHEINHWQNISGNIYINHKFDSARQINFDINYLYYINNNPTSYLNNYYDSQNNFIKAEEIKAGKITPINIWVARVDYTTNIWNNFKLESGYKGSFSFLTNNVEVDSVVDNELKPNYSLSHISTLSENIQAAYMSLEGDLGKNTKFNLGLRYEYSNTRLTDNQTKETMSRIYGGIFPSFFISKALNAENIVQFSYGRRIGRPTFRDLAPLFIFLDPSTFFFGNDSIKFSITDNYKIDIRHKSFILSFEYSHANNAISSYEPLVLPGTNDQVFTSINLNRFDTYSVIASIPLKLNTWWQIQTNLLAVRQIIKTELFSQPINLTQNFLKVNITQSFQFPSSYSAELSGFYQSKKLIGINTLAGFGSLNIALQKKIQKNKASLRLSMTDVFSTITDDEIVNIPENNLNIHATFLSEYRVLKLTYTLNFGNTKLKSNNIRQTGIEEIKNRIN